MNYKLFTCPGIAELVSAFTVGLCQQFLKLDNTGKHRNPVGSK
jgi:hypothetical protein